MLSSPVAESTPSWHSLDAVECVAVLHSDLGTGLTQLQAGSQHREWGPNRLPEAAFIPMWRQQTVYGASKAAINLLSEGLRSELRDTSVAVTVIYPGAIGTNIAANSGLTMAASEDAPQRLVVAPADAGKAIVDAVVENKGRITIGQDAKTMWALNRMNPDTAANLIYKGMKDLLS